MLRVKERTREGAEKKSGACGKTTKSAVRREKTSVSYIGKGARIL